MGKKKGTKEGGDAKKEVKSKGEGENKKKDGENGVTAVLKMDMHCEGCAEKIVKLAKSIDGVEKAKAEWEANKLTVRGETLDPLELREELQGKTKKKVDLISPQLPKKEKDKDNKSSSASSDNKAKDKKPEDKKPKEPPVTTSVLKLDLHCAGCIEKIYKIASKTKGVQSISFDKDKDLVIVTGAVDGKALLESLREKIKRPVEVVQPKKDKDGGGGEGGGGGGGGGKKNKKGGGNGGKEGGDGGGGGDGAEESYGGAGEYFGGRNRMEYNGVPPGYGYNGVPPGYGYSGVPPGYGYNGLPPGYGYNGVPPGYGFVYGNPGNPLHAPQMFSDENPNACHVM